MGSGAYEQKLAAILYADVAGYSRLVGEDEHGTHRILSSYLDLFTTAIERHGGRLVEDRFVERAPIDRHDRAVVELDEDPLVVPIHVVRS